MRRHLLGLTVLTICLGGWPSSELRAQTGQEQVQAADTGAYARTPLAFRPYARFENAYKTFFLTELEYPGYGRNIPEPEHVDAVKIGFVGPIIGSVGESLGGPEEVVLRVNERQTRWDGYAASHLAPMGIKMLQGAQLAIAQANARGGYRGETPYQLVVRNDNGNWRSSGREVIMMAYQDSVWAILGTVDGANTHIAIRAALKAEVPVVNTADTDPTLVETNIPWVFRNITDDRQMSYLLAEFAFGELGLRRVAALRAVNRYGRVNIDEFRDAATRLGYPLVAELSYEEGDTLFRSQLQQIQELEADAVFTYGNSRESALILKQMRELGMDQWFLGSDRMVTQELVEVVGPAHGKVVAGYPYDPTSQDPQHLRFVQDFKDAFGEEPETYAAHAYDGMMMLMEAMERAGLNRALIRDELAATKIYHGVTGIQEYDAVFSDRSSASLAFLEDGRWEFRTRQEVLEPTYPPSVLDTPVVFEGWRGSSGPPANAGKVRIGLFAPDSGQAYGGALLAVERANATGGLGGLPLELVARWTDDPWRGGAKEVVRLAYDDEVAAVLGSWDGAATHVAEQVATKARIPLIAPVSSDPTLTYIRIPWIFRLPPNDEAQADAMVKEGILAHSLTSPGLITSSDHDGRTFAQVLLNRLAEAGKSPAFHLQLPPGAELSGLARRVRSFRLDCLILRAPPELALRILEELTEAGIQLPLLAPWVPGLPPEDLSSHYSGTIMALQPFHGAIHSTHAVGSPYAVFVQEYESRYGMRPTPVAAYYYDAVNLLVDALEGPGGSGRPALRDAIAERSGFVGVTGPIWWDNGGGNQGDPVLLLLPEPTSVEEGSQSSEGGFP